MLSHSVVWELFNICWAAAVFSPMKTPRSFCYLELTICVCVSISYMLLYLHIQFCVLFIRTKNIWFSLFLSLPFCCPFCLLVCGHFVYFIVHSNFSDDFYNGHKLFVVCVLNGCTRKTLKMKPKTNVSIDIDKRECLVRCHANDSTFLCSSNLN